MNCPVCGETTNILGSKADCESVLRKRKCCACDYIFYTEEYESATSEKEYKRMLREYNQKAQARYRERKGE